MPETHGKWVALGIFRDGSGVEGMEILQPPPPNRHTQNHSPEPSRTAEPRTIPSNPPNPRTPEPGYPLSDEMIHDARIIPIGDTPHLPSTMRQYFGDSRGHWEGDTLVVDVTNFPTTIVNYRGATGALHLTERLRRVDSKAVHYEVTVSDPATFSKPWTAALTLRQDPRITDIYEYACHEGNYAMRNILSGARTAEAAPRKEER